MIDINVLSLYRQVTHQFHITPIKVYESSSLLLDHSLYLPYFEIRLYLYPENGLHIFFTNYMSTQDLYKWPGEIEDFDSLLLTTTDDDYANRIYYILYDLFDFIELRTLGPARKYSLI